MPPARRTLRVALTCVAIASVCATAQAHHPEEPFAAPGTEPFELIEGFESPDDCLGCHRFVDPPDRVAPGDTWPGSMHANSYRDPIFQAALTIANQYYVDAGSFCLRCHAPVGWLDGRSLPGNGSGLNEEQEKGITCAFCHRLDSGEQRLVPGPLIGNGSYYIHDEVRYRGPYADAPSLHRTIQDPYIESAELCGICHSVTNPSQPYISADGAQQLAQFHPEQRTYEEWAASAYAEEGVTCQQCHMPRRTGRAASPEQAPLRDNVGVHDFAGANAFATLLMKDISPPAMAADFDHAYQRALESLAASATIEIADVPATAPGDAPLPVRVRVTNLTGHKLPTGYPEGRRMWLEVEARVDDGAPFFTSGAYDPEAADLPHDAQLVTYESVHGRVDTGQNFALLFNDTIFSDSRIPPRGFAPGADVELFTPDAAERYRDEDGSWRHWDDATYVLPAPPVDAGVVTVTVTLWYQTITREYVEWLRAANRTDARGETLYALWEANGRGRRWPRSAPRRARGSRGLRSERTCAMAGTTTTTTRSTRGRTAPVSAR
jgi:mono/diheme cytochrome c family protein